MMVGRCVEGPRYPLVHMLLTFDGDMCIVELQNLMNKLKAQGFHNHFASLGLI